MKHIVHTLAAASVLLFSQVAPAQEPPGGTTPNVSNPIIVVVPGSAQGGAYLSEAQRRALQDHYRQQDRRAWFCPPGLSRKNGNCLPPGQARKWGVGQALPVEIGSQQVPDEVLRRIGINSTGVDIVRVLNDILVMRKGDRLIVDLVEIASP